MGFWSTIGALAGAKAIHNRLNPPMVTVPSEFEIVSLKSSGMGSWKIKYRKKGSGTTQLMKIDRNTRSMTGGWEFHWD